MTPTHTIHGCNRRFCLAIVVLLLLAGRAPAAEVMLPGDEQEPFIRLAESLASSEEVKRLDFAWIAVSEMAREYETILQDSATAKPHKHSSRYKLARWRQATTGFVAELHWLRERVSYSGDIRVHVEAGQLVTLLVDNRPIVISGPEPSNSRLMQQRIFNTYCELYDCSDILDAPPAPTITVSQPGKGAWVLAQRRGARYQTPDGLTFLFSSLSDRATKEALCEQVATELRTLAATLREARAGGFELDWEKIAVQPLPNSGTSYLLLNGKGEYLRQSLPALERTQALSKGLLAWTRRMVEEQAPGTAVIQADQLLRPPTR